MDTHVAKDIIAVIRTEQQRKVLLLEGADFDFADYAWEFIHTQLVNELCLIVTALVIASGRKRADWFCGPRRFQPGN